MDTQEDSPVKRNKSMKNARNQSEKQANRDNKPLFPAFISAIAKGDTSKVNAILKNHSSYATYVSPVDGATPLMRAAWNGHLALAQQFLALDSACLNQKNKDGKTALYFAAENGHLNVVKYLLEQPSIDIDASENEVGTTPLMIAVEFKHTNIVKQLLDKGANLAVLDKRSNTVLTRAAFDVKLEWEVLDLLLQKMQALNLLSSLIDKQNHEGYTALVFAVAKGRADKIECLLKYGADPNIIRNGTNIVLAHLISSNTLKENIPNFKLVMPYSKQLIIQIDHKPTSLLEYVLGHKNIEALYFLMDTYADHKDFWFNPHQLVQHIGFLLLRYYTITDQKEKAQLALIVTKLLYTCGVVVPKEGQSPLPMINLDQILIYGVKHDKLNSFFTKTSLIDGIDIDKIRPMGRTLLSHAVEWDNQNLVKQLLNYKVNVDRADLSGRTALAYAAAGGHWIVFNQLVDAGASIYAIDREGKTILSYALAGWMAYDNIRSAKVLGYLGYLCILQTLINKKVDVTVLPLETYLELLDFVLNEKAQQVPELLGKVKLFDRLMSQLDHPANLLSILNKLGDYAVPYLKQTDRLGRSLLSYTAEKGSLTLVQSLLKSEANPHQQDKEKRTPLLYAIQSKQGNTAVIRELLHKDIDLTHHDRSGHDALYYAVHHNRKDVVDLLLSKIEEKVLSHLTSLCGAIFLAQRHGYDAIANSLLSCIAPILEDQDPEDWCAPIAKKRPSDKHNCTIFYSKHAQERIAQRHIFKEKIDAIINNKNGQSSVSKTCSTVAKLVEDGLCVVMATHQKKVMVVTAYWLK